MQPPGILARPWTSRAWSALLVPLLGVALSCRATTPGQPGAPQTTASVTGRVLFREDPPKPKLIRSHGREGWALDESLRVEEDGGVANALVTVEVESAPEWTRDTATVVISENTARPRITLVSPGTSVKFENRHNFDAYFPMDGMSDDMFDIPPMGSTTVKVPGTGMYRFRG